MDASSSSRFYTTKARESEGVAELEAMTLEGTEGASTSGRTEYYSARCEAMMRSRGQFSDAVALEIEFSKSHWSEVSRLEVAPQPSAEEEELNRENKELLKQLKEEYSYLFEHDFDGYVLDRMIAKGGQAEIYELVGHPHYVMKVFERGTSLRDLKQSWPLPVLNEEIRQCIFYAGILEDGRFAFLMEKCWGDLRKLIDQAMQEKNVDGIQGPPFPYNGWEEANGWNFQPVEFMLGIVRHMLTLHEKGVSHRDLKASNILLCRNFRGNRPVKIDNLIIVADFECSIGVLGTGFWRGPEILSTLGNTKTITNEQWQKADVYSYGMTCLEILSTLGNTKTITNEQWQKADVYSYGMTCFEIITGRIPFDGELRNTQGDRQLVIEGKRPQLPSDLDGAIKELITKCWAPNPNLRLTFSEIVNMVETISTRQCQFRLFGIGDELPLQYHLATIQEINDYPLALMKAMPRWEIANLANGSIDGYSYGMNTRLEKQSDASHKLARLHY